MGFTGETGVFTAYPTPFFSGTFLSYAGSNVVAFLYKNSSANWVYPSPSYPNTTSFKPPVYGRYLITATITAQTPAAVSLTLSDAYSVILRTVGIAAANAGTSSYLFKFTCITNFTPVANLYRLIFTQGGESIPNTGFFTMFKLA
jgi:hypothetical protein